MDPRQALEEICEAWNQLDADQLAAPFTDDGRFEDPLKDRVLIGRQEIRDGNAVAMDLLAECRVTLGVVVADADTGFAEGTFASELKQGGRLDFPFAMLVEMDGGRVRRVAEYFDTRPLVP